MVVSYVFSHFPSAAAAAATFSYVSSLASFSIITLESERPVKSYAAANGVLHFAVLFHVYETLLILPWKLRGKGKGRENYLSRERQKMVPTWVVG